MKVSGITVGDTTPRDSRTMEEFVGSEWAETLAGKLLIALAAETAWSGEYEVYAHPAGNKPYLNIRHTSFLPERSLLIYPGPGIESVRHVEDAVRAHLQQSEDSLKPVVSLLHGKQSGLYHAREAIPIGKAKAAIVAAFPEAADAYHNHLLGTSDLYGFVLSEDKDRHEQIFFARVMDGEFTRGIAWVNMSSLTWYCDKDNNELQKHRRFWEALALTFAANELGIPEKNLYCQKVDAEEKPHLWPRPVGYDPYVVREALFRQQFTDDQIVVTFGADNLPSIVTLVRGSEEAEA